MNVTKSNKTRVRLKYLRDELCLKWNVIAKMPEFNQPKRIPKQTLFMIYKGERDVPKKFRLQLDELKPVEVNPCPECGQVHLHTHGEKVFNPANQKIYNKNSNPKDLFSMTKNQILWKLENREVLSNE